METFANGWDDGFEREEGGEALEQEGGLDGEPLAKTSEQGLEAQTDEAGRKPESDREWAAWRKKTKARAEALAAKQTAKLDAEVAARFGHLKNPLNGQAVRTAQEYFEALNAQEVLEGSPFAQTSRPEADNRPSGGKEVGAEQKPVLKGTRYVAQGAPRAQAAGEELVAGALSEARQAQAATPAVPSAAQWPAPAAEGLGVEQGFGHKEEGTQRPNATETDLAAENEVAFELESGLAGALAAKERQLAELRDAHETAKTAQLALGDHLLDEQVAAIARLDPAVKSFDDIVRMDNFAAFDRMVQGGQDLVSAYKAVHFERLAKQSAEAARRAADRRAAGKGHMVRLPGAAGHDGSAEIPSDALGIWRQMFEGESDAQLRARYNGAKKV